MTVALEKLIEKDKKQLTQVRTLEELSEVDPESRKKIDEIKAKMRKNPVNELGKEAFPDDNIPSNFAKGFLSVGGYLYAFGDFVARYTGFRDWQECSASVVEDLECSYEQDKVHQDAEFTKKLTEAIIKNERGVGDIFIKSAKKYMLQNKTYFTGRVIGTNILASRVTDRRIGPKIKVGEKEIDLKKINPAAFPLGISGAYMDAVYYMRNVDTSVSLNEVSPELIDLYARYIILGK